MRKNFRRTLASLLVIVMLICAVPMSVSAAGELYYDGDFEYIIENDYAVFTGLKEKQSGMVFIPGMLGGYPVKRIARNNLYSFEGKLSGCKLIIPQGVESIGSYCFERAGISEVFIPKSIKNLSFCSFNYCSGIKVRYEGNETDKENISVEFGGIWAYEFYRASEWIYNVSYDNLYEEANVDKNTGKEIKSEPDGYDFNDDSYSFPNPTEKIPLHVYQRVYGTVKGIWIYWLQESFEKEHGLCFGMASTTAALLKNRSAIHSFTCEAISEPYAMRALIYGEENYSPLFDLNLPDYIRYAHIAQYSSELQNGKQANKDALENLCLATKNYVNGGEPLILSMFNGEGGHAVYVIGIKEDTNEFKIIVNDSNTPLEKQYFIVSKDYSSWKYSAAGLSYNSDNGYFTFRFPADLIYFLGLENAKDKKLSENNNVISSNIVLSNENLNEVTDTVANNTNSENIKQERHLYWMDNNKNEISITSNSDAASVIVSDVGSAITANIPNNVTANFFVDDESFNKINYNDILEGESIGITYTNSSLENKKLELSINGTVSSNTVSATQTETGIVVTGLSDGTVTLTKDDEVIGTQEIKDAVSDIEITYDKDGTTDNMDVDYETDKSTSHCNCLCHKTGFLGFIYKIVRIFWKIFKINKTCACGAQHY